MGNLGASIPDGKQHWVASRSISLAEKSSVEIKLSMALILCVRAQIGYGSNKKTRHLMPSGHKAFLVHNTSDVDLLLMHNKTFAAEYGYRRAGNPPY